MRRGFLTFLVALLPTAAIAEPRPIEVHQVLAVSGSADASVAALTLDACDGGFDADLIEGLKHLRDRRFRFVKLNEAQVVPAPKRRS